jgi:hypothetical protein
MNLLPPRPDENELAGRLEKESLSPMKWRKESMGLFVAGSSSSRQPAVVGRGCCKTLETVDFGNWHFLPVI